MIHKKIGVLWFVDGTVDVDINNPDTPPNETYFHEYEYNAIEQQLADSKEMNAELVRASALYLKNSKTKWCLCKLQTDGNYCSACNSEIDITALLKRAKESTNE